MNLSAHNRFTSTAALVAGALALSGCSGTQEDVRITFCKNLTSALVSAPSDVKWQEPRSSINAPEFAAITVEFISGSGNTSATCYYEYELMHETAMDHANPLLAYATLPYEMILNGEPVSTSLLTKITGDEQIRQGKVALERVKEVADEAGQTLREGASNTAKAVQEGVSEAVTTVKKKVDQARQELKDRL